MSRWWNEGTRQSLLQSARVAANYAYCPHSKFKVGAAALMLDAGDRHYIFQGCNIENASYGLTICAERCAIFRAVSSGYKNLVAIAVCCPSYQKGMPISATMPCGACRQVMDEFCIDRDMPIYVDNVDEIFKLSVLLPVSFRL